MDWTARSQSPILRLPVELLSYIFVLGTHSATSYPSWHEEPQEAPSFNADSVKTPLVFSAVNRHWRTVALNAPALWTSLCITVGSLDGVTDTETPRAPVLNTSHVTSYLSLSRSYPIDILIDARDMDWDFCEPEIPNFNDYVDYTPPFSPQTMVAVVSLLLPHLSRWRSIDILTDTWAPMYAALNVLNESLTTRGAPLLESLTLMRCNDFISHSPHFQPRHMRLPLFLKPRATNTPCPLVSGLLPRLRNLTLRGVHVCWSSLPPLFHTCPSSPLLSLELSSHCLDVRPSIVEFRTILSSCPLLRKLTINGSGFALDKAKSKQGPSNRAPLTDYEEPIHLSHLQELSLGFRSTLDVRKILALFSAPNVRKLRLEDASHPGELDEVDGDDILRYLATGETGETRTQDSDSPDGAILAGVRQEEAGHSRRGSTSSGVPTSNSHEKLQGTPTRQPFPFLEVVALYRVKVDPEVLNSFLVALLNAKTLVLNHIPFSMNIFHDSLPIAPHPISIVNSIPPRMIEAQQFITTPSSFDILSPLSCRPSVQRCLDSTLSLPPRPCPKLRKLCIWNVRISPPDLELFVRSLACGKRRGGWPNLHCVEIHLDVTDETTIPDLLSHLSTECLRRSLESPILLERYSSSVEGNLAVLRIPMPKASDGITTEEIEVKIVKPRPLDLTSEGDDNDVLSDNENDGPFRLGGEFNDLILEA